jgi:tripartite-type tricarboxylate transporter receptor subunit TctC
VKNYFLLITLTVLLVSALVFSSCTQPAPTTTPVPAPAPKPAQPSEADFYKGKTMTWLIGWGPGGGHDLYSRMIGSALEKTIGATVVPKNMEGANGMVSWNNLHNSAKPDGLTVAWFSGTTAAVSQLIEEDGVQYDLKNFNWMARAAIDTQIVVAGKVSGIKTIEDLKKLPKIKYGANNRTGMMAMPCPAIDLAFNLNNISMVVGYASNPAVQLATTRGEVDIQGSSVESSLKLIESGDHIPLVVVDFERSKYLPNVPTIYELAQKMSPESKRWVDTLCSVLTIGRSIATTPNVPESRVSFLRNAFDKILKDPAFVKDAKAQGREIDYMSGQEYTKIITGLSLSKEDKAKFKSMLDKY